MTILALDASSNLGSVAVRRDGHTTEVALRSDTGFAHLLFGAIDECLRQAGVSPIAVDCFAASSGPGSFTGVRIGLTAAKGLGESTSKPVIAISNLKALASSFRKNEGSLAAVALDARRGEVYGGVYTATNKLVGAESVLQLPRWLDTLDPSLDYEFVSPGPLHLRGTHFEKMPFTLAQGPLAGGIARLAEQEILSGRIPDVAELDANYVRRSDAELFWKD